jgi:hypothetical protein
MTPQPPPKEKNRRRRHLLAARGQQLFSRVDAQQKHQQLQPSPPRRRREFIAVNPDGGVIDPDEGALAERRRLTYTGVRKLLQPLETQLHGTKQYNVQQFSRGGNKQQLPPEVTPTWWFNGASVLSVDPTTDTDVPGAYFRNAAPAGLNTSSRGAPTTPSPIIKGKDADADARAAAYCERREVLRTIREFSFGLTTAKGVGGGHTVPHERRQQLEWLEGIGRCNRQHASHPEHRSLLQQPGHPVASIF